MTLRNLFSLFAAGATLAVSAPAPAEAAPAATPVPDACFAKHRLGPIAAYRRQDQQSNGYEVELAGARVFVYAEPGLTAEWLHYSLEQRRAAAGSNSLCPIDVPGARLTVQSGGPGFWVTLSTENAAAAREILKRAERLEPH